MTREKREKAIDKLKVDIEYWENASVSAEHLYMAIKALEQDPCEDCVSRKAVRDTIFEECTGNKLDIDFAKVLMLQRAIKALPPVTPTRKEWIPLVFDEYPTVDSDGNDDYVYAVDYSIPMPKDDEQVLITDENHNVIPVQYDGYDFGDYARENILAWQPFPESYKKGV